MSFTPLRPLASPDSSTSPTIPRTPPRRAERRKRGEYSWFYVLGGVIVLSLLCVLAFRSQLDVEASRLLVVTVRSEGVDEERSLAHLVELAVQSSTVAWKLVVFFSTAESASSQARSLAARFPGSVVVSSTDNLYNTISATNADELFVADSPLHQDSIDVAVGLQHRGWPTRILLDNSHTREPDVGTLAERVPILDIAHLKFASGSADSPSLPVYIAVTALITLAAGATWIGRRST